MTGKMLHLSVKTMKIKELHAATMEPASPFGLGANFILKPMARRGSRVPKA